MQVVNHIEIREDQAYIRGTNKKAAMVARMYVGTEYSIEEVMEQYNLRAAEVHAAIAYYYDNQEALDARHQQAINYMGRRKRAHPGPIQGKNCRPRCR